MIKPGGPTPLKIPPPGAVASVTGICPTVVDNTDPANPIITFECTRDTQANILGLQQAGNLCNGEWYTIIDMPSPLQEATFLAMYDGVNGNVNLQQFGQGINNAPINFIVGYDLETNEIYYLEHQPLCQIAKRDLGSGYNCIETMNWGDPNWSNNYFDNTDINNLAADTIISYCHFPALSTIDIDSHTGIEIHQTYGTNIATRINIRANNVVFGATGPNYIESSIITADVSVNNLWMVGSIVVTNGFSISQAYIFNFVDTITLQADATGIIIDRSGSTAVASLDAAANFAAGTLTVPGTFSYCGRIILTNAAGGNITKIIPAQSLFEWEVTNANGISNTVTVTAVGGAAANNIVGNTAGNIVLVGRTNGTDFVRLMQSGTFNQLVYS